ncbi:hypothetical protein M5C96_11880 [Acidovorax sp. GBBC 1281]|nr:hypothetical protein [Acidovorax sp. GBBC 1281]WCN00034.1 hypothetical protein M5C96_11880 [Acidovorax sp. GBBC 1281]
MPSLIWSDYQRAASLCATKPFTWTATADSILEKLARLCGRINGTGH